MAGDWLKIEVALPDKPEVWQIAGITGIDPDCVVGKLFKVWRWFDAHTSDGEAIGVGLPVVDCVAGLPGFAEAMTSCGWLVQDGAALRVPKFESHNGKTAKTRADTARRVAKHKAGKNDDVTRCTLPRPLVNAVRLRDKATCVYCGRREGEYVPPETSRDARMCIDHVVPFSKGGSDDLGNLVCACSSCNMFKSDRTPDECGLPWPKDSEGNAFGNKSCVSSALPREEKRREEKEQIAVRSPAGSRLAADWKPTDEELAWAKKERPDLNLALEADSFRDFWVGKAGAGGRKSDWPATWRNWVRRANAPRGYVAPSEPTVAGGGRRLLG